jgi:hypothetical protein
MVEKHFNISIAPVRSRGGSLVNDKDNFNSIIRAFIVSLRFAHARGIGRAVGYGPFFLCVMYKEGLCPAVGTLIG